MKNFEVLVQKNGRIEWLPVPGCINYNEARDQGEKMYAGKVIQTRFLGVSSSTSSSSSSSSSGGDWEGGFALCAIALGGIIIISLWPLFLVGGLSYLGYKLYKKYVQNESNS
jgi:hypothetical protein